MRLKFKDPGPKLQFERPTTDWQPEPLPQLQPGEPVALDFEFKPHHNPAKLEPVGYSVWRPYERKGYYVPFGHLGGGNVPRDGAVEWLRQLSGRDVYGFATKFEVHCARNLGCDVDLTRWHDVAFNATLLNENRRSGFSLESLAEEYLPPGERKVHPPTVDPADFYLAHASEVAERCVSDSYLAWRLHEATRDAVVSEGLVGVLELEDSIIPAVCEMERNAFRINTEKLAAWLRAVDDRVAARSLRLANQLGTKALNPNAPEDMAMAFRALGLAKPKAWDEEAHGYRESWAEEALETVDHPLVRELLAIKKLLSIKSKYLLKYRDQADGDQVHFNLHQLRSDSDSSSPNMGTVTGRFSSGGPPTYVNSQQVMKVEKQVEEMGPDFLIRELVIPQDGLEMGASDASQIEFRLFAHYGNARSIIEAYQRDPYTDFHLTVTKMFCPDERDERELKKLRKELKHDNFGKIYGMGRAKLARRRGLACLCDRVWSRGFDPDNPAAPRFSRNEDHDAGCQARRANDLADEYDRKFPEAGKLLKKASHVAETRGFVHTLLGRRRRYPEGKRLHSALNAVIQGSAADVFKRKLLELYRERKTLGITLRAPVHDEFVLDIEPDSVKKLQLQELLDEQSFQLRVPLLWESGFGRNWKEANEDKTFMKTYSWKGLVE